MKVFVKTSLAPLAMAECLMMSSMSLIKLMPFASVM